MSAPTTVQISLCRHPLVAHDLHTIRDQNTPSEAFRQAMSRVATLVFHQATARLPLASARVTTPLSETDSHILDPQQPIVLIPILRAGLILSEIALQWLPMAHVHHLGLYRNEETLQPVVYYNKLNTDPARMGNGLFFVLDPMLATGGSADAALALLKSHGVAEERISLVCLIAAPEGVAHINQQHPGVQIYAAALDDHLNERGYIVPGLGDAGDRTFGT
ncbi:MAG: uracil phosphoribosyltransferase [Candidatus Melainabacteria bacterium]|nr:uracil phosphoribosyltransferase [Candidatus Melainabacteria bacterium]